MPEAERDSASGTALVLTTLGRAELARPDGEGGLSVVLGPGKPLALIVYLACAPSHSARREHLIDVLWADLEPDAARHALRQCVWYIRQRVGEAVVTARNGDVLFCGTLRFDRDEFLEAVTGGRLEKAVRYFTGDFLPDFAIPGGTEFEQWADVERYRLRLVFAAAAETLTRKHLTAGRFREALQIARRLRDVGRERQATWRLLLETLLSAGDSMQAVVEADALRRKLQREGRQLEPATADLLRAIEQPEKAAFLPDDSSAQSRRAAALHSELVGREVEFSTIIRAWEQVRSGNSRHIHVTAPAGLGKTRLLNDVAQRLRAAGECVAAVRAHPGDRGVGFAVASDVAAALVALAGSRGISRESAATLVGLNPTLSSTFDVAADHTSGQEALRRRTTAVSELIAAVADEQPVALLIDDIHWTDAQSRQLLQGTVERFTSDPVLLVTASRPGPQGTLGYSGSVQLSLAALSCQQVTQLVASLGRLPDNEAWVERLPKSLHAASSGSPLLLLESLQLAMERGSLSLEHDTWGCPNEQLLFAHLEAGGALKHRITQLYRNEAWILELLAVAGMPLTTDVLLDAAGGGNEDRMERLTDLERRGLLSRAGEHWAPGHDEMAELVVSSASPEVIRAAHCAVGRALAGTADGDPELRAHAVRHLAAGGQVREAIPVFTGWIRRARSRGDRRGVGELAREVLGEESATLPARDLVRALPLGTRLGVRGRRALAGAAAVAGGLSVALIMVATDESRTPEAELIVAAPFDPGALQWYAVPVDLGDWPVNRPIVPERDGRRIRALEGIAGHHVVRRQPGGEAWITEQAFSDSGGLDLVLIEASGQRRRLTFSPGDDHGAAWSPDGRKVVFETARWNERSWYDLAVLDLASGETYALVRGDSSYTNPMWSPDGCRIAYSRGWILTRSSGPCWTTMDGGAEQCATSLGTNVPDQAGPLGWINGEHLVIRATTGDSTSHFILNVTNRAAQPLALGFSMSDEIAVSPGGRWIAVGQAESDKSVLSWSVWPFGRPELARPIRLHEGVVRGHQVRWSDGASPAYLDSINISLPPSGIAVNAGHQLTVTGIGSDNTPMRANALSFRLDDPSVATVDQSGFILPLREGSTKLHVSAGGWRKDSFDLQVTPPHSQTALEEDWAPDYTDRWRVYGYPEPTIDTGPAGIRAMWNRGDGSFLSGAYSRRSFSAEEGLGVEVALSSSINDVQWQDVRVAIAPVDSTALADWDHETEYPPGAPTTANASNCGVLYPDRANVDVIVFLRVNRFIVPVHGRMQSGEWWRLTLQLFPDGTCGVAVNGTAVARSGAPHPLDEPHRIFLDGSSRGTKTLHGPLRVWQGVNGDIDWRVLHRADGGGRGR